MLARNWDALSVTERWKQSLFLGAGIGTWAGGGVLGRHVSNRRAAQAQNAARSEPTQYVGVLLGRDGHVVPTASGAPVLLVLGADGLPVTDSRGRVLQWTQRPDGRVVQTPLSRAQLHSSIRRPFDSMCPRAWSRRRRVMPRRLWWTRRARTPKSIRRRSTCIACTTLMPYGGEESARPGGASNTRPRTRTHGLAIAAMALGRLRFAPHLAILRKRVRRIGRCSNDAYTGTLIGTCLHGCTSYDRCADVVVDDAREYGGIAPVRSHRGWRPADGVQLGVGP